MTAVTFQTMINDLNADAIFKGQYTFALARDYDPTQPLGGSWSPFDMATGQLDSTLKTTQGFKQIGYFDVNALEFSPTITTSDTEAAQARQSLFTDITKVGESAMYTAIERNPYVEALEENIPFASMGTIGQAGYQYTKPVFMAPIPRQFIFGALFTSKFGAEMWCRVYPFAQMVKPDKLQLQPKTEAQSKQTIESHVDTLAAFAARTFKDGPGWRARGGLTGATGTPVATVGGGAGLASLTFTAPTSLNSPFTYLVFLDSSLTPLSSSQVTVGGTAGNPVLSLTGITPTGAHTFKVQAVGSNLAAGPISPASNSITTT